MLPLLHQQAGYRGGMTSIDRAGAVVGVISMWEDRNALEAGEGIAADLRAAPPRESCLAGILGIPDASTSR